MSKIPSTRTPDLLSIEPKSRIQNPKWLGLSAIAFVLVLTGAVAEAQQTGKIFRMGLLDASSASGIAGLLAAFWQEMGKHGWIEGKNITVEYRFAEQKFERLPELAVELVGLKLDLIVVAGTPSALAVKKVTTTVPIVITNTGNPVAAGWLAVWRDQERM